MADLISKDTRQLLREVMRLGVSKSAVLEFLFSLKCVYMAEPGLDNMQVNSRMADLGWQDVGLDDRLLKSATKCFRTEAQIN